MNFDFSIAVQQSARSMEFSTQKIWCCVLVVFDWLHPMNESAWPNSVCVGNLECSEWRCPLLPTGCVNTERNATECCEVCIDCVDPRGNPPIPAVIGNPPLDAGYVYQPLPTPTRRRKRDAIVYIASKFWVLSWSMINSRYWIVGCNIWIEVSWCWLKLNLLVLGIHSFKWSDYFIASKLRVTSLLMATHL